MKVNRSLNRQMLKNCQYSYSQSFQIHSRKLSCRLYQTHLRLLKLLLFNNNKRGDNGIPLSSNKQRKSSCHRNNQLFKYKRLLGCYMIWQGQELSIQLCTKYINLSHNVQNTNHSGKKHQSSNNKTST